MLGLVDKSDRVKALAEFDAESYRTATAKQEHSVVVLEHDTKESLMGWEKVRNIHTSTGRRLKILPLQLSPVTGSSLVMGVSDLMEMLDLVYLVDSSLEESSSITWIPSLAFFEVLTKTRSSSSSVSTSL
jgi:hypothetical protein